MLPGVSVQFSSVKVFRQGQPVRDEQVQYVRDANGVQHCVYINGLTGERRRCDGSSTSAAPFSSFTPYTRGFEFHQPVMMAAPPLYTYPYSHAQQQFQPSYPLALMPPQAPMATELPSNVRVGPRQIESPALRYVPSMP